MDEERTTAVVQGYLDKLAVTDPQSPSSALCWSRPFIACTYSAPHCCTGATRA